MMKPKYTICIALLTFFSACNHTDEILPAQYDGDWIPVILEGEAPEAMIETRAVTDFPNEQRIAVTGALYQNGSTVWTSYPEIQNAPAEATRESGGRFYFTWDDMKYFPFDGSQLVFLAYSPVPDGNAVTADNTTLNLQLVENMPDVMYASKNTSLVPYSKANNAVDLGEFRHAMSQVTVKVIADPSMNPSVLLQGLVVGTYRRTATLNLLQGDNGLTLGARETIQYPYTLTSTPTLFYDNEFSSTIYLFPGTEADTEVLIALSDGTFTIDGRHPVSQFENVDNPGNYDILFQRGVHTTLIFNVRGISVENPEGSIVLQGQLTEWIDSGSYEVTVK